MDDVVKLFMVKKLFSDDFAQVIVSAPSEHLKYQSLLESLQKFKLSVWIIICDLLCDKSLEHVSSLIMEGKTLYVNIYTQKCRCKIVHVKLT